MGNEPKTSYMKYVFGGSTSGQKTDKTPDEQQGSFYKSLYNTLSNGLAKPAEYTTWVYQESKRDGSTVKTAVGWTLNAATSFMGIKSSDIDMEKRNLEMDLTRISIYESQLRCKKLENELGLPPSKFTYNILNTAAFENF